MGVATELSARGIFLYGDVDFLGEGDLSTIFAGDLGLEDADLLLGLVLIIDLLVADDDLLDGDDFLPLSKLKTAGLSGPGGGVRISFFVLLGDLPLGDLYREDGVFLVLDGLTGLPDFKGVAVLAGDLPRGDFGDARGEFLASANLAGLTDLAGVAVFSVESDLLLGD